MLNLLLLYIKNILFLPSINRKFDISLTYSYLCTRI